VDDDSNVIDMVKQLLENTNYAIQDAPNGKKALAMIKENTPDAVLLDLMMPEMDGFGVIEALKKNSVYKDLPIIVLTAKSLTKEEAGILQDSVIKIIQKKGLESDSLINEIMEAVE
ncbi:MAG: response regulator, partial [Chloroflexota bacterium]